MMIIEVQTAKQRQEFHDIPRIIYENLPNWICPLDSEIEAIFDPEKNIKFKQGEACRWIMKDENDNPIGRIAAFFDKREHYLFNIPTGGVGFFECIDNVKAANRLFDVSKKWLESKGVEAMDGPINFGSLESYWGLLVDGFTPPGFTMPYNPSYYKKLFENYGFQVFYNQYTYHLNIHKQFPNRFWKIAEWITRKKEYTVRYFNFKEQEKFVHDFVEIYNQTWPTFKQDFVPVTPEEIRKVLNDAKLIIDESMILFAYQFDKPIAFCVNFPDLNQILKYFNGKLNFIQKIRFLYLLKFTKTITRLRGIIFGVIPCCQKTGIDSLIYLYLKKSLDKKTHYQELELSWVGDFNPRQQKLWRKFGAIESKHYITYRYLFDRKTEFQRYPLMICEEKD